MSCVKFLFQSPFTLVQIHWSLFGLVDSTWQSFLFFNQFNSLQSIKLRVATAFFSICHWIPSGAHSFHGQVVYGFILNKFFAQLLPNKLELGTHLCNYLFILSVIYSFIYSVTSFPVESWASMPYEHREKPTKAYILYESTQDTMCHIGHTILGQLCCQLPLQPSVVLDQWTCASGIVSTDVIVYLLKRLLVLPLVDDTFLHLAALINSNILSL